MAVVALLLWLFTAGAGTSLLVRSNLGRPGPSDVPRERAAAAAAPAAAAAAASVAATLPAPQSALSEAQIRKAARSRFDPPSLVASRNAPLLPGSRALLEFMHPACAIVGLGFWLGFTLVHARVLGWIAFGLITVTACLGLSWFAANNRAARRQANPGPAASDAAGPAPSFNGRLVAVHGAAAGLTFVLAALSALILKA
jgi:hypothetical protein